MTPDLETLSREIAATSDAVRLAIAAVKANPPDDESPMPWSVNSKFLEDANGEDVAGFGYRLDAECARARIAFAPILAAEVERLLPHAAECAALADLHILCADAGVPPGHIVERVRALTTALAALTAPPPEVAIHPDGCFSADPADAADCNGDGHYSCKSCKRFDAPEVWK